jgi:hypothetical protein
MKAKYSFLAAALMSVAALGVAPPAQAGTHTYERGVGTGHINATWQQVSQYLPDAHETTDYVAITGKVFSKGGALLDARAAAAASNSASAPYNEWVYSNIYFAGNVVSTGTKRECDQGSCSNASVNIEKNVWQDSYAWTPLPLLTITIKGSLDSYLNLLASAQSANGPLGSDTRNFKAAMASSVNGNAGLSARASHSVELATVAKLKLTGEGKLIDVSSSTGSEHKLSKYYDGKFLSKTYYHTAAQNTLSTGAGKLTFDAAICTGSLAAALLGTPLPVCLGLQHFPFELSDWGSVYTNTGTLWDATN